MTMKYKGTGMYPDKETCELEVTVEMYSSETVWTFDIDDKSDYYSSASIGMSTAEVTRLRDELNLLIEHERKHREFRGNIPADYVINEAMIPEEQEDKV